MRRRILCAALGLGELRSHLLHARDGGGAKALATALLWSSFPSSSALKAADVSVCFEPLSGMKSFQSRCIEEVRHR